MTFNVTNDGRPSHNLEIEGNGVEEEDRRPPARSTTAISPSTWSPGSYEIYCAIDSHKDMGMEGELTVQ